MSSGIGANTDSFLEYMLKASILFNDDEFYDMFSDAYFAIQKYLKDHSGYFYFNANMYSGLIANNWVDSLSAFWPGLQVTSLLMLGSIRESARCCQVSFAILLHMEKVQRFTRTI